MPDSSHMDVRIIFDLTVLHSFKCIFNLGPRDVNMLQAPRYLNLPLPHYCELRFLIIEKQSSLSSTDKKCLL